MKCKLWFGKQCFLPKTYYTNKDLFVISNKDCQVDINSYGKWPNTYDVIYRVDFTIDIF